MMERLVRGLVRWRGLVLWTLVAGPVWTLGWGLCVVVRPVLRFWVQWPSYDFALGRFF